MCFDNILKNCILFQLIYSNHLYRLYLFTATNSLQLIYNSTVNKFSNFAFPLSRFIGVALLAKRV